MINLSDSIKFLRNAAPEEFEQFYQALVRYSDEVRKDLVRAPDKLEVMQGQAQMCEKIVQLLNGESRGK
jgi:hypothetical protein